MAYKLKKSDQSKYNPFSSNLFVAKVNDKPKRVCTECRNSIKMNGPMKRHRAHSGKETGFFCAYTDCDVKWLKKMRKS